MKNTHIVKCLKSNAKPGSAYDPTNDKYQTMARKHENHKKNNNIFNGKNLSDHTKASRFY